MLVLIARLWTGQLNLLGNELLLQHNTCTNHNYARFYITGLGGSSLDSFPGLHAQPCRSLGTRLPLLPLLLDYNTTLVLTVPGSLPLVWTLALLPLLLGYSTWTTGMPLFVNYCNKFTLMKDLGILPRSSQ